MRSGVARLRWAIALMILCTPALAAGVASAGVGPALGRWSGSGQGGKVYFVVSRVGGTDVFSDLVEQCANGTPSAGDIPWRTHPPGREADFRPEAAIGANGRIHSLFRVPRTGVTAFEYNVHGTLSGGRGRLTVHKSGDGDQSCVIRNADVSRTGGRTLVDGDYMVSGGAPGTDVELSVFGDGAEVWWSGLFGTPIGGVEDDPELCAEVEDTAFGVGDAFLGRGARTFASHDVALLGAVLFAGHFIGRTHGLGGYLATSYPVCSGGGALVWKLAKLAPPLAPAVPLHGGSPPPPPPKRHRRRHHRHRHHHHPRRTVRYVALGDSFSAGEGVQPYEPGTATVRDRCHRSRRAYSRLVSLAHIRFVRSFYACSGATTPDVLSRSRYGEVPQLDHPRLHRAQLVTISIGGNDAGFVKVLIECTRLYGRLHHSRCYRQSAAHRILGGIEALRGTLASTFEAIRGRTGLQAKIVVLDYPNLFPAQGCRKLNAVFDEHAQTFMRTAGGVLDATIAAAASQAHVQFVDVRQEFAQHELCARKEWVDFLVRPRARRPGAITGSFHPNAAGQRAYARVLRRALEHIL
jgi:lysophospholipase L1-like esterase